MLSMLVALVLPPLLVHRMPPSEYSAWVLILQCSSYINLLELGLQTAIGKFVAEYDAAGDRISSNRVLSSSFAILCMSATLGAITIAVVAWQVPLIFHQMPASLIGEVRVGILAVGLSTVFALPFGAFLAVFTGLQQYGFPTVLALLSRGLSSASLVVLILMHGSLVQLALTLGAFNVLTALAQFWGWKKYASDRVDFHLLQAERKMAMQLARYSGVLSVWMVATLFVSGLDILIVGHYDYKNTGYYGIATSATNFMLVVIGGMFGPIVPAISSLQAGWTAKQIGNLTIRATRYCGLLLGLVGTLLVFGAYPLLKLWVGSDYAMHSALFLQLLVVGNAIRQLGNPYSLVVVAVGKQHLATIAAVSEALVNVTVSIWLVQRIGAAGVAIGTFTGAFVSVGLHVALSMRLTQPSISMSRWKFLMQGIFRPLLCVVPAVLLIPMWKKFEMLPVGIPWMILGAAASLGIAWFVGLTGEERSTFRGKLSRLPGWPVTPMRGADS
ncbi:oligosaccharide flippase family protein [Acidicapsa dinghuensis]|uniref:Oligosaccharide flippase family protein n=1 Tax=Acidicapsa dinghuensis TaxID=2218256 RepID=A0ABW1EIP5_9BACT|nr:oligosaccharide flippase family protein [Acidicapsa dinghuensis]